MNKAIIKTNRRDCTEYCKSVIHGNMIIAAITKRSVTDFELCTYLDFLCGNCEFVKDTVGKNALHIAASCGRDELMSWLIRIKNADINSKDGESGYTPLHRALFYGNIDVAVVLMKLGANTLILDSDNLTPFEHVIYDGLVPFCHYGSIYTWGLNYNNRLGPFSSKKTAESLDVFHKKFPNVFIQKVCIDEFHSIFLTNDGDVYSCGHGLGGRLGLGTEKSVVESRRIDLGTKESIKILDIAIGRNHSLFLTTDQELYVVGSNKYKVLGINHVEEKILCPQKMKKSFPKPIEGITAGRFHSALWTSTGLYVWGFNVGQLGCATNGNLYVNTPKFVRVVNETESSIKQIVSSDFAIGVLTGRGDIYILYDYTCKKIASRMLDAVEISIIGGKINSKLDKKELEDLKNCRSIELKLLIRTKGGCLYLWQESDQYVCRCIFTISKLMIIQQAILNENEILFITNYGEAYKAFVKPRRKKVELKKKNDFHKFLNKDECVFLDFYKISKIHRAISIVSDPKGEDYCVIQQDPYRNNYPTTSDGELQYKLGKLLEEASEDDNIHDVIVTIEKRKFPLHKFILAHGSKIVNECSEAQEVILKDVKEEFFEQLLKFLYTGTCDLLQIGKCPKQFQKYCENGNKKNSNPIRMFQNISKKCGCTILHKILNEFDMIEYKIIRKGEINLSNISYKTQDFPEFYDLVLKCDDHQLLKAHRCILAARLDYFNSLFSVRWNDSNVSTINIAHPSYLVKAFLEFLYTDSAEFLSHKDTDFLMKLLVIADEYLLTSLKHNCECFLQDTSRLDLKNAVELLQFAQIYKAVVLKKGVNQFIVNNMVHFLENNLLNDLPDELLKDLSESYKQKNQMCSRIVTPYSVAISDEEIADVTNTHSVNIETPEVKKNRKTPNRFSKKKGSTPKIMENETKEENTENIMQFNMEINTSENFEANEVEKFVSATITESEKFGTDSSNIQDKFNEFPSLNNSKENKINGNNTPSIKTHKLEIKHKIQRLSQKERKRLSSESKDISHSPPATTKSPWKIIRPPQVTSPIVSPEKEMSFSKILPNDKIQKENLIEFIDELLPYSPPETSKSPWQIIPPPVITSPIVSPENESSFSTILFNEKKQKENLIKITNKLLSHTQMEDKAILDLERFYSADNIEDEIITVERVNIGFIASPKWVSKNTS